MFEINVKKKLHSSQGEMLLDIALQIKKGTFLSLYGKSGAGKTTLLKILAGLVVPDEGNVKAIGETWFDKSKKIDITPQKRNIGFVFQDYALFPNMTIQQNLEFVVPHKSNKNQIKEIMDIMELTKLAPHYPSTLSGGQQQRVALARALVRKPTLLLLDEPFAALDNQMRSTLQDEITKIHKHFGLTTILISHQPADILKLSDHIVEIDHGQIVKQGKPDEIFPFYEIVGNTQLQGKVMDITENDTTFVAKIISGNQLIEITITKHQATDIKSGDEVLINSKAIITK
jgi:molybdate transport system ATP-binding protein